MKKHTTQNCIDASQAYNKQTTLSILDISQAGWDQMLNNGLPFAWIGSRKWVTGRAILQYMEDMSQTKCSGGTTDV